MKTKSIITNLLTLASIAVFAGCGTTSGYKQADKTGEGIAQFRAAIVNGKKAIDDTMKSLGQVATSATTNPRKAFERYSKDVANLESAAKDARKCSQDMKDQGKAYFTQWEKQLAEVQNPDIRALAVERKARLQQAFDAIRQYAEPLKAQFDPWLSDLKDLQKYLSNDLTIAGVDAAKPRFAKTQTEGLDVQKSMDALVVELNSVAATITPAKAK
jgi:hypothetical protein